MDTYHTRDELMIAFNYDSDTGVFTRAKRPRKGPSLEDKLPGYIDGRGYIVLSLNKKKYYAHRLAWLFVTGYWPEDVIDHKDGNCSNNKFSNLRECSNIENRRNSSIRSDNKHGLKGARPHARYPHIWTARIKGKHLGSFNSAEEAHDAYMKAANELYGEFACDGKRGNRKNFPEGA